MLTNGEDFVPFQSMGHEFEFLLLSLRKALSYGEVPSIPGFVR